jgi:hypothetical protein
MTSNLLDIEWRDLHDAILNSIVVGWGKRAWVRVNLSPNAAYISPTRPIVIVASELTLLECPQHNPWGPSDFINSVTERTAEDGGQRIEIQMQSGDVIVVEASSFDLIEEDSAPRGEHRSA